MRNSVLILSLAAILSSPFVFASLHKELKNNVFRHTSEKLKINRDVAFTGYTYIFNLLAYSDQAAMQKTKSLPKDSTLDIDIVYAEAVRFYSAGHRPYNGLIAYIVKTKDGEWYMKFQLPVQQRMLKVPANMGAKIIPDSNRFRLGVGMGMGMGVSGASAVPVVCISGEQSDADAYANTIPKKYHIENHMHYIWATVLLTPGSNEWNRDALRLNFADLSCSYEVLESAEFDASELSAY